MPYGGATMSSIISTICAYFHTHHGNETRTYFVIFFHFTYVQKQRSKKKHVPWKAPLRRHCEIGFENCPSGTWSFIVKHNALTHNRWRFGQQQLSCSCRRAKLWLAELFYPNPGLRSLSPRLGNRNVQHYSDSILPEPGDGWPRLGTELAESNGGDGLRFASAPIGWIILI